MVTKSVILVCHNKPELMDILTKSFNIEKILKIDRKFLRFDGTSFVYRYRLLIKLKPTVVLCERKKIDGQNCRGDGKITKVAYYKKYKICQECYANLTSNTYRGRVERGELKIVASLIFLFLLSFSYASAENLQNVTLSYNKNWSINSNESVTITSSSEVSNITIEYDKNYTTLILTKRISLGEYESIFLVGNKTGLISMTFIVDDTNQSIYISVDKDGESRFIINSIVRYLKELVNDVSPWEMFLIILIACVFILCLVVIAIVSSRHKKIKTKDY